MKTLTSTLVVALTLAACDGGPSSPTQPSATSPPASSLVSDWSVTQTFVSVSGPDNCWVREQRARLTGAVFGDIPMEVTRSGASILLESDYFDVNYAGTANGNEFSASGGPLGGGGRPCADGTSFQQMPGNSDLSGRFSPDDQQLTATEVNSYRLTSGEPVTYTWDWQATRRN
jgi:hypothetical protein